MKLSSDLTNEGGSLRSSELASESQNPKILTQALRA